MIKPQKSVASRTIGNSTVDFCREILPNGTFGRMIFQVKIKAVIRDKYYSYGMVRPEDTGNLRHMIEVTAGAIAEHLCEVIGDVLDPDVCAKEAGNAYAELLEFISANWKYGIETHLLGELG